MKVCACMQMQPAPLYISMFIFPLTDTTGLQSSIAVMELNGSITVTCTFATGASSTGCQVSIFTMGSSEEVLSTKITRPDGASQVSNMK